MGNSRTAEELRHRQVLTTNDAVHAQGDYDDEFISTACGDKKCTEHPK